MGNIHLHYIYIYIYIYERKKEKRMAFIWLYILMHDCIHASRNDLTIQEKNCEMVYLICTLFYIIFRSLLFRKRIMK